MINLVSSSKNCSTGQFGEIIPVTADECKSSKAGK